MSNIVSTGISEQSICLRSHPDDVYEAVLATAKESPGLKLNYHNNIIRRIEAETKLMKKGAFNTLIVQVNNWGYTTEIHAYCYVHYSEMISSLRGRTTLMQHTVINDFFKRLTSHLPEDG